MRSNKELRQVAAEAIRGKWVWRLLVVLFLLQSVGQAVSQLLARFNASQGIVSVGDFWQKKISALQQGLDYALPTRDAYAQMWVATGFEYFVAALFGAIALFGLTAVALRAIRNEDEGWFASGLGGFRYPLGVTVLIIVQNLIVGLWSLLLLIPGIVAAYRYRLVWYLKCENPDWGVMRCLGESARMMKGYKMRAFSFDLAYFAFLLLLGLCAAVGFVLGSAQPWMRIVGMMIVSGAVVAGLYVMVWFVAGRAAFYRELKAELTPEVQNDLPGND